MHLNVKITEVVILFFVSSMALVANLPDGMIGQLVDRNLLLITLVVTVVISLFRYLKLMLFIAVSVLAIGANLPDQLASQLGVNQLAMIVSSGALVIIALLYKLYPLIQFKKGREIKEDSISSKHDTIQSRNEVITAILNGDIASLHQLLISDVEINFSQNGHVPLFLSIEKGYPDLVFLLLSHGAKLRVKNKAGQTPIEFALLHQDMRVAKILHYASSQNLTVRNSALSPFQQKGKIVVMFADICGSTALYDKLGNKSALDVINRTLNILKQEVATHKGTLIKTIGDEIMCSFPSVAIAAQAACAMHFAIDARQPGGEHSICVRIGFHYGEVIHQENDVFGDTVNIAARVAAITRARQIMTTQTVIDALPSGYADKVHSVSRAGFQGKQDSSDVFQILWEPENSYIGRVGQSGFRKQYENGNELFSDIEAVEYYHQEADLNETISLGNSSQTNPRQLMKR